MRSFTIASVLSSAAASGFQVGGYLENWKEYNGYENFNVVYYSFLTLDNLPNADSPNEKQWDGSAIYETMTLAPIMDVIPQTDPLWDNQYEWQRSKMQKVIDDVNGSGKRFVWAIGGWSDLTKTIADSQIPTFVDQVVTLLKHGGDGVDFDWEYPGFEHEGEPLPGMPKVGDPENCNNCNTTKCQYTERNQDGERYAKFLTEVKAALAVEQKARNRKDEYIISMAGPGGQDKLEKLDLVTMCKAFTYINVMTYDMHGSFDSITNHQSPMKCVPDAGKDYCYSVEGIIQAYLDGGCKAEQLHIGVPTYAHMYDKVAKGDGPLPGLYQNFSGPSESVCQKTPSECVPTYKKDGAMWAANKHWDNVSQASYAYDGSTFYSFDDVQSIGAKTAYLKEKGLGGFMYWFIGGDDASNTILTTMSNGLKAAATKLGA